jgi:hypothetical protein
MALITKLLQTIEVFQWTLECQHVWEAIKQQYVDALISIALRWDMNFTSNLAANAMLAQNPIGKCNQPIMYAF